MDPYHMQLPGFSESQGLNCSDPLNHDLCSDTRHMMYTGLNSLDMDPTPSATDIAMDTLEDNLDALSLYSVKDCDSAKLLNESDSDSQPSLHELGLLAPPAPKEAEQRGRSNTGSARKGKHQHSSPQSPFLDCSFCGKVFSSASSLSKHCLTHSQERKHVCKVCSKAFKRPDHLSAHMLTHQKTKPFICIEQGCNKSYCDHRSLRRHYEMSQHGLCILKEMPSDEGTCEASPPSHDARVQAEQGGVGTTEKLAGRLESRPNSVVPNRDLFKHIVSGVVKQKLPSTAVSFAGHSDTDLKESLQPCSSSSGQVLCLPASTAAHIETTGDVLKEHNRCQKSTASSNVYAVFNPSNLSVIAPGESIVTNLTNRPLLSEPQFPLETTGEEYWPNSALPCFPLFRSQKISANSLQCSGNFQWIRNMPVCAISGQDISDGFAGPSHAFDSFAQAYECPDTLSFTPVTFNSPGEMSSKTTLSSFEETFRRTKRHGCDIDYYRWQNHGELNLQDAQKQSVLQDTTSPLFRQFFVKSQETAGNQEEKQVQQHLLQFITKSQHILSPTQVVAPSQLVASEMKQTVAKPVQNIFQQQQPDVTRCLPELAECEGSHVYVQKILTHQFQKDVSSGGEKQVQMGRQQTASVLQCLQSRSLKGCLEFKDISSPGQPQPATCENAVGSHYGKPSLLESIPSTSNKKGKGKRYAKETGDKLHARGGRSRRLPGVQKDKLKFDPSCAVSPSQVAMDSFSLPCTSSSHVMGEKRKLTIFNRIQGGKIYSLTNAVKEENLLAGCNKTSAGHMDGRKCESGFICKNCSQLFYTEKGLSSHMCFHSEQWQSPQGRNEQQVHDAENLNPQTLFLKPVSDGNTPSDMKKPLDDGTVVPLVIPVSVPVTATDEQAGNKVNNQESQGVQDSSTHQKKRKRQTRSKSLFIPTPMPLCGEMQSSIGGCYQSNLRSPVYLVDHLVRDFFQYSPYTPPPMLSPIREGSGLYFNTVCSSSEKGDPSQLFSTILDRMDGDFGFSLVKDNTKISIEPHINIGSQFQAEIPNLQDRSVLENDEHGASLVWKPWGNIATNQEMQDRVTELLDVACSSAMPGGGTNLELALHCLHEAQGNILKAVEMLLFGGPQKPASHPLADYHYTGSDVWMPVEKQLFRKAFCLHKKDFYLIQQKTACSPWKRHGPLPKHNMNIKPKNYRKASNDAYSPAFGLKGTPAQPGSTDCQGVFPCKECERVFDKVKSRNAHMKRHRPQEHVEPLVKSKWSIKQVRNEPELEETQVLTSSNGNWEIVVAE
ncbi:zinc finger protein 541 isoform X2 [Alligator sinensis]|uniref:Zinc finger protein 541 isoform X2 n=1 Tax=Alligator sinensis TaxID=38654 RepID=A0A1U8DFF3_ALLSI|nr:zinc finger protein 541 isoform X2 [Alligator sinensis]